VGLWLVGVLLLPEKDLVSIWSQRKTVVYDCCDFLFVASLRNLAAVDLCALVAAVVDS